MAASIGAQGFLGLALETTPGTYVAPTKYIPFMSESIVQKQENIYRRPIRQTPDQVSAVPGYYHVEGDIEMEAFEESTIYFHYASRCTIVKSGATNYVYTITPGTGIATPKTMSLTIIRSGVVFGYVGCVVGNLEYSVGNDGMLMFKVGILGLSEATQSLPTATWTTTQVPYGPGGLAIQVPTGTPITDTDNFTFTVEDNAETVNRINATTRGGLFVKFGERHVTAQLDRDFVDKTDYTAFVAGTASTISLVASKGVNNSITINMLSGIRDQYEVSNQNQGDLIRASVTYEGVLDATGYPYSIVIKNQENIT